MKTVSIISIVYGTLGLIWAGVISVIIKFQQALFENIPFPDDVNEIIDIGAFMDNIYGTIGTLFPFIFIIAAIYIISGILHLTGNPSFKTFVYIAAILNIIWYVAYVVLIQIEVVPLINSLEMVPRGLINLVVIFSMLINIGIYCGYPIFLFFYMRKGKEWDILDTGYQN